MTDMYEGPRDADFIDTYGKDAPFIPPIEGGKETKLGRFLMLESMCPVKSERLTDPQLRAQFVDDGLIAARAMPLEGKDHLIFQRD